MSMNDDRLGEAADSTGDRRREADYRSARRQLARRRAVQRRRRLAGLALVLAAVVAIALISDGFSGTGPRAIVKGPQPVAGSRSVAGSHPLAARAGVSPPRARAHPAAAPGPGSLPQTHAYPSGRSARFKALMASLWSGIAEGSAAPAVAAFFPKEAYVQLKAIPSAGSDWVGRLLHDYSLDVEAAHALLGADAARAQLIAVEVPASYGHWVAPGACYNDIGYYEVANARVVYREDGQTRSFGIASMISWRGEWYVVHLGAVLRSSETGTVDEPESGPGTSAYSGTC